MSPAISSPPPITAAPASESSSGMLASIRGLAHSRTPAAASTGPAISRNIASRDAAYQERRSRPQRAVPAVR